MASALNLTAQRNLLHAAEKIETAGSSDGDVHTPFPVHGMDAAMGLGKSWLSAPVLAGGITGLLTALGLTMIPSFFLYPMIVHGKAVQFLHVPGFLPDLLRAHRALLGVHDGVLDHGFNRLPMWYHPVFNWERFKRATDDGFFIVVEAR
jgi:hypothetical protein